MEKCILKVFFALCLTACCQIGFGQITGTIKDGRTPVVGANVVVKGTKNGTTTDLNGRFNLYASFGDTLVVTYAAIEPIEFPVQKDKKDYSIDILGFAILSRMETFLDSLTGANSELKIRTRYDIVGQKKKKAFFDDTERIATLGDLRKLKRKTIKSLDRQRQSALSELLKKPGLTDNEEGEVRKKLREEYLKGVEIAGNTYKRNARILGDYYDYRVFLPARNQITAVRYYSKDEFKQFDFGRYNSVTALIENGSVSNEIAASYLGPVRLSFNTVLSKQKAAKASPEDIANLDEKGLENLLRSIDSTNIANSTLFKVASGGGEATLTFKYPIFNTANRASSSPLALLSEFTGKASADLPVAGSYIDKGEASFFTQCLLQNRVFYKLEPAKGTTEMNLFFMYNIGFIAGSKTFYENLKLDTSKGFWMTEWMAGIQVNNFSVFWTKQNFTISQLKNVIGGRIGVAYAIK